MLIKRLRIFSSTSDLYFIALRLKGNIDTSGLASGLVPIRSGDCGAKFKNISNLIYNYRFERDDLSF